MNKPRDGNVITRGLHREKDPDPYESHSFTRKMESGLAEPKRDSLRNRFLAQRNGWTDPEYWHWVETGDPPIRSHVNPTPATKPEEIDDDERLHK